MKGISKLVVITWLALLSTVPMIFAEEAVNTPKALRGADQDAEISIPPQSQTILIDPVRAPSLRVYANRAVIRVPSKLAATTTKHARAFRRATVVKPSSGGGSDSSDSDSSDSDSSDSDSKDSDSSDSDSKDSDSSDSDSKDSSDSDSSDSDSKDSSDSDSSDSDSKDSKDSDRSGSSSKH